MESSHVFELLKTGGIIAGAVLTLLIALVLLKYVVPLVRANGSGTAPILTALQNLAGLPAEIKTLGVEIRAFTKSIEDHVPTKADLMEQFQANRHEMRNIVNESTALTQGRIEELMGMKMRIKQRRRKERRK